MNYCVGETFALKCGAICSKKFVMFEELCSADVCSVPGAERVFCMVERVEIFANSSNSSSGSSCSGCGVNGNTTQMTRVEQFAKTSTVKLPPKTATSTPYWQIE